jgi:hypothetical protein
MRMARTPKAHCLTVVSALALALVLAMSAPAWAAPPSVLSPSLTAWNFGNGDIHSGGGPTQTFTFTNNTPGIVTVSTLDVVGSNASEFQLIANTCPGAILPTTGSCNVQVTFSATSTGPQTAALEITDDSGTLDVPLSGTGITGTLTASPNPLDFTPQPWFNGGQQQSITIQNSNDAGTQATSTIITGPDASRFYIAWGQNCSSQQYRPGWICGMGIGFNPPNGPGTFHAQLEVSSDSLSSPLIVPLNATALSGPHAVMSPAQTDFGDVAIGHSAAQIVTVANDGDYPMQIQQAFMVTDTPSDVPITADNCSGQIVNPGSACQFTVTYQPTAASDLDASVILITNGNGSITPIGFSGDGVPTVNGAATITGMPAAGSTLTCNPVGYPGGTSYAYQWLRNAHLVAGASTPQLVLHDTDVGARFVCRIVATNPVSTQTVSSPTTAAIAPLTLTGQPGAFTDQGTCRSLQADHLLRPGRRAVSVSYGSPATPWAPLTLSSAIALRVRIDGHVVGVGKLVTISPRSLSVFADGSHTLTVTGAGTSSQSRLLLGPCLLAVRLNGGPQQVTTLAASSRYGISTLTFRLPPSLHLTTRLGRKLGWATLKPAGYPSRGFNLIGPRTTSNDATVAFTAHTVTVTNLPAQTGVIILTLRAGVLYGHPGIVRLAAHQRGSRTLLHASTPATWLP